VSLEISVDVHAAAPPYEQIRSQVAAHIYAGNLVDGDRLPTVRALAADLGVAAGTVGRAYTELEAEGLVISRRGHGTRVTRSDPTPSEERLRAAATALARQAHVEGVSAETLMAAVQGAFLATIPDRPTTPDPGT
jgi:GntR family transcriptional regulator